MDALIAKQKERIEMLERHERQIIKLIYLMFGMLLWIIILSAIVFKYTGKG